MTELEPVKETELHLSLSRSEAGQLRFLLDRSLNTLKPDLWPEWSQMLLDRLEKFTND